MLHHHLLPVPGTGRERNVVYDAGDAIECLQRAGVNLVLSGHKHVPVCVAAREPVRRQHRHRLVRCASAAHAALLQRGRGRRASHVAIWRRYPFHGQERIIQFDLATLEYEKYTGRIEREVTAQAVMAPSR